MKEVFINESTRLIDPNQALVGAQKKIKEEGLVVRGALVVS